MTVALAAAIAAIATGCGPGSVRVTPPTAEPGAAKACAALHAQLPKNVGDQGRRRTEPPSDRTAAWGDPAAVLRCGVGRPEGYRPKFTPILEVGEVTWYQHIAGPMIEWVAVDRPVYVELAIPRTYDGQGAFLIDLAPSITATLTKRPG